MDLLAGLNDKQKEAVLHTEGPLLILAGAGSGKTRVLTHRIAYMIHENGVKPGNILAITFTNKAASEMKERAEKIVGSISKDMWITTFHSMCVRILRQTIHKLGFSNQFTIYDGDDQKKLVEECIKELGYDEKIYPAKKAQSIISSQKNDFITSEQFEQQMLGDFSGMKYAEIYKLYQEKLTRNNCLDFDDLIFKTIEVLKNHEDVREYYQEKFKYIMVDEYQDTNNSQFILVEILGAKYRNVCVVGDDDQSLYSWRGANVRNILDFEKKFKEAKSIKLEQNYRCTKTILGAANDVIKNNENRKDKTLWTENTQGDAINLYNAYDDKDEAMFIVSKIISEVETGKDEYNNFAILYRTNAQSRVIEEMLINKNIPYQLYGGVKFYERKEIKDILAYLKLIINPSDNISLGRIINVPKRAIGDSSVDKVADYANKIKSPIYDVLLQLRMIIELQSLAPKMEQFTEIIEKIKQNIDGKNIADVVNLVLETTGYSKMLKAESTEEAQNRLENIDQFIAKAQEYDETHEEKSLANFLEEVSLVADIDTYEENNNSVKLMTMHTSKGLEFPQVFIAGVEEGIFPSYMSLSSGDEDQIEEERRICYVGITRAKEKLYITYANARRQFGKMVFNRPSRFLEEIPKEYTKSENAKKSESREAVKSSFRMTESVMANKHTTFSAMSLPKPSNVAMSFNVGDKVKHPKFGPGTIEEVRNAGADYELTIDFGFNGVKKLLSKFANLSKTEE